MNYSVYLRMMIPGLVRTQSMTISPGGGRVKLGETVFCSNFGKWDIKRVKTYPPVVISILEFYCEFMVINKKSVCSFWFLLIVWSLNHMEFERTRLTLKNHYLKCVTGQVWRRYFRESRRCQERYLVHHTIQNDEGNLLWLYYFQQRMNTI